MQGWLPWARARTALACYCGLATASAWASSLQYCQGQVEPGAVVQDRLIQVAGRLKEELEHSGRRLAIVARSGLDLKRFDQRYSHAGISLRHSPNTPWSVRQLYYACDEQRPRIFDQGMAGFVLGANNPDQGYISVLLLPDEASAALEQVALSEQQSLQLLANTYSANAYAFGLRYQNCNQWLAELLAGAWGAFDAGDATRERAQQWLRDHDYEPTVLHVGWRPLMALADLLPWLHSDDHPQADLAESQFRVSMPESIAAFVHAHLPEATRMELCYTAENVVVHHGWDSVAAGCLPGAGDVVTRFADR